MYLNKCFATLLVFLWTLCSTKLFGQQLSYDLPHKRFEYKYSFKGPYLAQKDGTVPFWAYDGNAIASEEMVRITPSLRSKKGSVWTKTKTSFEWWEVELIFRVNGRGRLGADGLAFWFTDERATEGPVFGSADNWKGLALLFDSFDNDNKGNNPYIMAMINDGSKSYDHQSDGINQQLAGCLRDFRNKPFPVRAKIEYYKNVLAVMFHSGNTNNEDEYELCLRAENIFLPQFGYFGVSAATGGLADDHDVLKFLTYSLHVPGTEPKPAPGIADSEKERFAREYEEYKHKLDQQKEEYLKSHPEEAKRLQNEGNAPEEEYDFGTRELQQIFEGQSQVFESVKHLNRKLDEIVGRQERVLSMLSAVQSGAAPIQANQQYAGGAPQLPLNRHEVEALLGNQREVVQTSRELKTLLIQQQQQQPSAVPQNGQQTAQYNQQMQQSLTEVRDGINGLNRELSSLGNRIDTRASAAVGCPPVPSCLSSFSFFIAISIHLIIIMAYMLYKASRESAAKKFY
ncbi:protein ERGIC-53-like [Oppia nitens]|uniref:protein ERGIC-53-like n=1 Tax=Oppia nitens TaxID=1686743 RepID=UPI0023DBE3ED|nr:protein ERGIC-53-like [Oppia nitens]